MRMYKEGEFWFLEDGDWCVKSHESNTTVNRLIEEVTKLQLELSVLIKAIDEPNLSCCCGAPIYEDTDICSDCKEHI